MTAAAAHAAMLVAIHDVLRGADVSHRTVQRAARRGELTLLRIPGRRCAWIDVGRLAAWLAERGHADAGRRVLALAASRYTLAAGAAVVKK